MLKAAEKSSTRKTGNWPLDLAVWGLLVTFINKGSFTDVMGDESLNEAG